MTSRERLIRTLNHQDPGRVLVDLGSTVASGIHAGALDRLRKALGLEYRPVKVYDPYGMLGLVEEDVVEALGIDVLPVAPLGTLFGYKNESWKPWKLMDGTEVLIGGGFSYREDAEGNYLVIPGGDARAAPSAKMPKGGFFFDNLVRQQPIDEAALNARDDYSEDFDLFDDGDLRYLEETSKRLYESTGYGLNGGNFLGRIGDFATLPAPWLKNPRGVRSIEDWLAFHHIHPEYVKETYEIQVVSVLENLKLFHQAVGDRIQAIQISGTDFGSQKGLFISADMYVEFYKPYHRRINDWVHEYTNWKTYYHSCGSVVELFDDFIESGWDIFNPVQCSAAGMDPRTLKSNFGDRLVLWGGVTDTQKTLPFGTPEEVRKEVLQRLAIFAPGGGYVASTIHNIQYNTPTENIIALFEAIKEYNRGFSK
jgi:hypothetical protein